MTPPLTVIVAGNATRDTLLDVDHLPSPDEVLRVRGRRGCFGGRGVVPAVTFSRAATRTSLYTVIGGSARAAIEPFLETHDIDVSHVVWIETDSLPLARYTALIGRDDGRHVAFVEPADVDWVSAEVPPTPRHVDVLYLSTQNPAFNSRLVAGIDASLVVQNLGISLRDDADYLTVLRDSVDVIVANTVESETFTRDTGLSPPELLRSASRLRYFVVTAGRDDIRCYDRGATHPFVHPVEPIDRPICPVGAGDSFAAALSVALARGFDITEAMDVGSALGALAVESPNSFVEPVAARSIFAMYGL